MPFLILICFLLVQAPAFASAQDSPEQRIKQAAQKEEVGDYEGAQAIYEDILKTEPQYEPALFGLAQVQHWQGHYDKSLKTFGKLLAVNPNHVAGLIGIAKVYLGLGKEKKAQEYLAKAKKLDPENEEVKVLTPQLEKKTKIRVYAGYQVEDISYSGSSTQASVEEVEFSKEKTYGFGLRASYWDKFDLNGLDTRLFGHYYFMENTRADLSFSFAPSVTILPRESVTAGFAHSIGKLTPELHYSFVNYTQADQHLVTPALFYEPIEWIRAGGGYEYQRLTFGGNRDLHSGFAELRVAPLEWFEVEGFYRRVQSSFEGGRPGNAFVSYSAHVGGGGIVLTAPSSYSIRFSAYTEQRNNGEQIASYTLTVGTVF